MLSRMILLLTLCPLWVHAIEGAVSLNIIQKKTYFISEEVVVQVNLKSTALSIKNAKIELENSKDYIVKIPKSAVSLETININETDWQVVHYEYKLYPLHAGKIDIPKVDISFSASMGYGQPEKVFNLSSKALQFTVQAPEGIDSSTFVLSTTDYSVKSSISLTMNKENATQIKVGDAITLKITQKAKKVPDILLRPSQIKRNDYFSIYPEEPQLKREQSFAIRKDTYTLVALKEGNITIPPQIFVWWDTKNKHLNKEITDSYFFEILPNPVLEKESTIEEKNNREWIYWTATIAAFFILLYVLYPHYNMWSRRRKFAFAHSEEGLYKKLLASPDNTTLYENFYIWLEAISPKLAKEGFKGIIAAQPTFENALKNFEIVLARQEHEFDKIDFFKEAARLRAQLHLKKKQQSLIPSINP